MAVLIVPLVAHFVLRIIFDEIPGTALVTTGSSAILVDASQSAPTDRWEWLGNTTKRE
jgi:hypothetical protein